MEQKFDVIVVGGGVLGTFHAYHALLKGYSVCLVEKNSKPRGATAQNFGQVVPSGMATKWQNFGRESLKIYKEIQSRFDITLRQNGTVYLASNEEEEQLLIELRTINNENGYASRMLTKAECLEQYSGLKSTYVIAGLFFSEEVTVEPRTMIHRLQHYLIDSLGLVFKTNFQVVSCQKNNGVIEVVNSLNERLIAEKVVICNGADFSSLYPKLFRESDLEVSKLQMMQTKPQKNFKLSGSILTGWSIRRYESFKECPSYKEIKSRENPESFEKIWGVHILFKQAIDGSVILGDSHEYTDAKSADNLSYDLNMDIDNFMIKEAKKIFDLPTYDIQTRWYGMYSQCKTQDIFQKTIDNDIHIVTGIGGKGMTGSAGFSKYNISKILN